MKAYAATTILLGLLWIVTSKPLYAAQIEITLEDEVILSTSHYSLGDIARLTPSNNASVRELSKLVIGRSPRPNSVAHVSRNAIAARLRAALPGSLQHLKWLGVSTVKIQSAGVTFSGQRLTKLAEEYLHSQLDERYRDFEISAVSSTRDVILPPGRVSVAAQAKSENQIGKRHCIWLDIDVDGQFVQTLPIWFSVSIFKRVLVAVKAFDKGEPIIASGFRTAYLDITRANGTAIDQMTDIAAMRFTEPLSEGSILTREMLQDVPAVTKGQKVRVAVVVGSVALNTIAIALSDGEVQQKIRVKSQSGEDFSVVITGPAQTKIY